MAQIVGTTQAKPRRALPLEPLVALLLSLAIALIAAIIIYAVMDISLGTVFAIVILSIFISLSVAPILAGWKWAMTAAVTIAVASTMPVMLGFYDQPALTLPGLQLLMVCLAMNLLTIGSQQLFRDVVGDALASTVVLILAVAWLGWPVWMSPWFGSAAGTWMLDHALNLHPLIALNGAYQALGDWSHAPLAYKYLTRLGQDYLYTMPESSWPAIICHGGAGIVLIALCTLVRYLQHRLKKQKDPVV